MFLLFLECFQSTETQTLRLCVPEAEEDEDEEDDLLRRTGNFVASSDSLPSGILRVSESSRLLFVCQAVPPDSIQNIAHFTWLL